MEALFEVLFGFFGELLVQLVFEGLFDAISRGLDALFGKERPPLFVVLVYAFWGAVAGFISLGVFPDAFLRDPTLRLVNLIASPTLAGAAMALVGRWMGAKGRLVTPLERFGCAFLFAMTMASIRYVWAG